MKYNLTTLTPVVENESYALYTLGQVNENLWKGVRVNKKTNEQEEVKIQKLPQIKVIEVLQKTR